MKLCSGFQILIDELWYEYKKKIKNRINHYDMIILLLNQWLYPLVLLIPSYFLGISFSDRIQSGNRILSGQHV